MHLSRLSLVAGGGALAALAPSALAQLDPAVTVPTRLQPDHVVIADLNGDGAADLALTTEGLGNNDEITVHFNQGGGVMGGPVSVFLPNSSSPAGLAAADMDADGDTDLVVTLKDFNTVMVLLNDGAGGFTQQPDTGVGGDEPRHLALADLDGDGDLDVVTSNRESNDVSFLLSDGAGGLTLAGTRAVGADPRAVVATDLSGDGQADVAVSAHDVRRVDVLVNLGGATFGALTSLSVGSQLRPDGLAAGDVDGDGDADLVAATSGNGLNLISVFTNAGGSFAGPASFATGGVNPSGVVLADLDQDGDLDAAVANQDSASVSVLANTGAGSFGAPTLYAVGATPERLAVGDLDGNGGADLATADRDSSSSSLLFNQQGGGANPVSYCTSTPNSVGPGALIGSAGTVSIAANDFVVTASGAVPGSSALFFYGDVQTRFAFFDGVRCVDGNVTRLAPIVVAPDGTAASALDFPNPPQPSGTITAGSTWNFQLWYRDLGGAMGANLSDALQATFQP